MAGGKRGGMVVQFGFPVFSISIGVIPSEAVLQAERGISPDPKYSGVREHPIAPGN